MQSDQVVAVEFESVSRQVSGSNVQLAFELTLDGGNLRVHPLLYLPFFEIRHLQWWWIVTGLNGLPDSIDGVCSLIQWRGVVAVDWVARQSISVAIESPSTMTHSVVAIE
jgi:hypothetical protein